MALETDIRAFEQAVESGDSAEILRLAPAALRFIRMAAIEHGRELPDTTPADLVATISATGGGIEGFMQVQEALMAYMDRPNGPVELRLNGVYQGLESSVCVAIFDTEQAALAYFKSALLPEGQRYTDPGGYFRSFRSDSLCYNCNPCGPGQMTEGHEILTPMAPWEDYADTSLSLFGEEPPARNPEPLTGTPPPPPEGSRLRERSEAST